MTLWEKANELIRLVECQKARRSLWGWAKSKSDGRTFRAWCEAEGISTETGRRRKDRAVSVIVAKPQRSPWKRLALRPAKSPKLCLKRIPAPNSGPCCHGRMRKRQRQSLWLLPSGAVGGKNVMLYEEGLAFRRMPLHRALHGSSSL